MAMGTKPVGGDITMTSPVTASAGIVSFTDITGTKAGTYTLIASKAGFASIESAAFTLIPAQAYTFTVAGITSPVIAGTASDITVTVYDQYSNIVDWYRGTINFTSNDAQAALPANYTFTVSDSGIHTFSSSATLKTAGTKSVTAADLSSPSVNGTQSGITVWPAEVDHFTILGNSTQPAGMTQNINVTARDRYENICSTGPNAYTADTTLVFSGAQMLNGNYPSVTDKNGTVKKFGEATTLTITNGETTAGGTMKLFKVESARIYATGTVYLTDNPLIVNVTDNGPIVPPEPEPVPRPDDPRPEDNNSDLAFYLDNFLRRKQYKAGKYRTIVVVFEGSVVTAPYDESGVNMDEATIITAGQEISREAEIGDNQI
jgi:hypothetical protein